MKLQYPNDFENKIICGDHLDVLPYIHDGSIDLTVTSPPYDDLRSYKGYNFQFEKLANELYRVTKDGGVIVWVVGDATIKGSETGTSFRQALYFKEIGFNLHDTMIYMKNIGRPIGSKYCYNQVFEYMFIMTKGKIKTFDALKDHITNNFSNKVSYSEAGRQSGAKRYFKQKQKTKRWNVWLYNVGYGSSSKDKLAYNHPAIFPEKLAEDHIISWSNKGEIVLDPMSGSATTLKMAKKNNRKFIGIDISEEYCKIARARLLL